MANHHQAFEGLAQRARNYLRRVQNLSVAAGSAMADDDLFLAPIKRSFQEGPSQLLGSAADHLRLVGESGSRQDQPNPFAPATLIRSAITATATALWMLEGDQTQRRVHALQVISNDFLSYRTFINNTRAMYTTPDDVKGVEDELAEIERRLTWIVGEYNKLTGKNVSKISKVTEDVSDTKMVWAAGDLLDPALAPNRGLSPGVEILATWQYLSGYAHARPWAYVPSKTPKGPTNHLGMQSIEIAGNPDTILECAGQAALLIDKAFALTDGLAA